MTDNSDIKILLVDDDENNLYCGGHNLRRYIGFPNFAEANDGTTALDYLRQHADVDIILLDRMMTRMDGVPMVQKMRAELHYPYVEVIFQTGKVSLEDKQECLDIGSLYMLQKPYDPEEMGVVIKSLATYVRTKRRIRKMLEEPGDTTTTVTFRTLTEAEQAAATLARHYPQPLAVYEAIYALLANAVEHGNLSLGSSQKCDLLTKGDYTGAIQQRLDAPENKDKQATATLTKDSGTITLTIEDHGKGFNPDAILTFGPMQLREPNGRGLYLARKVFGQLEADGNGKIVCRMGV